MAKLTSVEQSRFYINTFHDYSKKVDNKIIDTDDNINETFKLQIEKKAKEFIEELERKEQYWLNDDYSVYTGFTGIMYTFYHYGRCFNKSSYINRAVSIIEKHLINIQDKRHFTFLMGMAGPLSLGAVILNNEGKIQESERFISMLISISNKALKKQYNVPDELLYGRAGYLFSLIYVNTHISPSPIKNTLISEVICCILKSGNEYASLKKYKSPIMFTWHGSDYIGGAHGLGGILYVLLQGHKYLTEAQLRDDLKPALYFLQTLKFSSGNFPSSINSNSDKLVQWCHGAPGMTALFALAYEIFNEHEFLQTALQCGEIVWSRGILRKGCGLCHGTSGNAYSFLQLYQITKETKYLYRACKFAEWCFEYKMHQNQEPDRTFSLFEGLAGIIYFLSDLHQPLLAKFPGYTI
ncbi:lanC-like protein 2 [Prorops nasuta]|uniref:lanC-like protein 2 n=1 Tax=Prorops nasuta TaxID=863751 RepID=UPI0034CFABD8